MRGAEEISNSLCPTAAGGSLPTLRDGAAANAVRKTGLADSVTLCPSAPIPAGLLPRCIGGPADRLPTSRSSAPPTSPGSRPPHRPPYPKRPAHPISTAGNRWSRERMLAAEIGIRSHRPSPPARATSNQSVEESSALCWHQRHYRETGYDRGPRQPWPIQRYPGDITNGRESFTPHDRHPPVHLQRDDTRPIPKEDRASRAPIETVGRTRIFRDNVLLKSGLSSRPSERNDPMSPFPLRPKRRSPKERRAKASKSNRSRDSRIVIGGNPTASTEAV